jgi:hypothetical protein
MKRRSRADGKPIKGRRRKPLRSRRRTTPKAASPSAAIQDAEVLRLTREALRLLPSRKIVVE